MRGISRVSLEVASFLGFLAPCLSASECSPPSNTFLTNSFAYSASSAQGAVGDVVALDFSLEILNAQVEIEGTHPNLYGFDLIGCFDPNLLELVGDAQFSDFLDQFAFLSYFYVFTEGRTEGVIDFFGGFKRDTWASVFASGEPVPLMTLYFRIKGQPGDVAQVRFCDDTLAGLSCESNDLLYSTTTPTNRSFQARSTLHSPGVIRVLDGEPTHPDPPQLPPNAKVYTEAPTPEMADIHFDLVGPAVTHPGATDIPFDFYVTSNFEFSGFMTSVTFPAQYLELTHLDEHTRPGVLAIDNEAGSFGILMSNSRRRVGAEDERVHLATLHFKVKDAARAATSLSLKVEPAGNYFNWLAIQFRNGVDPDVLPTTNEVTPLFVGQALVGVQTEPTPLGDVNFDSKLDVSDAISLLDYLFRGNTVTCLSAADFNEDGRTDISDSIAILRSLFLGGTTPAGRVYCDG